jgi:hypothetical protein
MRSTARWLRPIVVALGVLLLAAALLFLPPLADHFGYARPVPDGLPTQFTFSSWHLVKAHGCVGVFQRSIQGGPTTMGTYPCHTAGSSNRLAASCTTQQALRHSVLWPPLRVGSMSTIFGAAHPVYKAGFASSGPGFPLGLALVGDGLCYVIYRQT